MQRRRKSGARVYDILLLASAIRIIFRRKIIRPGRAWLRREGSTLRALLAHPASFVGLLFAVTVLCASEPDWTQAASPLVYTLLCTLYGLCIAALVCSIACSGSTRLVALLETCWLVSLGRISYGFYLYHNFVPNPARLTRVQALFHGAGEPS